MIEKFVTSRVKQKTATLAEWQNVWSSFVPYKGEQCVFIVPANSAEAAALGFTLANYIRHLSKTGDGTTSLQNLPWDGDVDNTSRSISNIEEDLGEVSALVGEESVETQINNAFDDRFFIGTQAEYTEANSQGLIKIGTVVFLTDDELSSSSTSSVLGVAVLGQMVLG